MIGVGLCIDKNDSDGNPIHIGDTLEFNEEEWGSKCIFQIILSDGKIQHPGTTDDLSSFCRIIRKFNVA